MCTGPPAVTVRVTGLTKAYGTVVAVRGASFSIRRGEVLGLIGPNGSGKTTLFACLGGVLPFDEGTIEQAAVPAGRAMFYLPDGVTPWPDQAVGWALEFATGYFGGDETLCTDLIDRLGLRPLLARRMKALSKGQRKRALLAVGLLTPHPILLADEPFDGLDLRQTREVATLLRSIAAGGRTLFLSIHQIADAARVCDRYVLLSDGRVCGEGTLEELTAKATQTEHDAAGGLEDVFLALT
jgi:ABC-2 type transport system ATP-binding protein